MSEKSKKDKEGELLLETYKLYMARLNEYAKINHADLKFFTGLSVAVLGAAVYVATGRFGTTNNAPTTLTWIVVVVGGFVAALVAYVGHLRFRKAYRAWLQTVASIGKLEKLLGLHLAQSTMFRRDDVQLLWDDEGIAAPEHDLASIEGRADWRTSKEFIDKMVNKGHGSIAKRLFLLLGICGACLVVFGVSQIIYEALKQC